jgi:lipoprotein-anchoring transpeptidase ErfK/SrfK
VRQVIRGSMRGAGLLALALVASCAAPGPAAQEERQEGAGHPDAVVSVTPANGSASVPTDATILVAAQGGALKSVQVRTGSGPVAGVLSADGTQWRSGKTIAPGTTYEVRAVAVNPDGRPTETVSSFSTVKAAERFAIKDMLPNKDFTGLTVGIGMPVMIRFDRPITDRVSVERNLVVRASRPVVGAWHWVDDEAVHFRPKRYWPAHTDVRVEARLAGVRGGDGLYGKQDYTLNFAIGRAQITSGSVKTHHLKVERDGKVIRTIPMSAGKGGVLKYHTTSGVHLAMSREPVTVMTSPDAAPGQPGYYQTTVYDAVRISNSGEYVHGAPWSVGSQGNANVSHGCVNISAENARWFRETTLIGDPIIITGSPRQLEPLNGWGHWQNDWEQWLKSSSLKGFTAESSV